MELVMQVSRGQDDRSSGTVRLAEGTDGRDFSGTLQLLRVFEELVPLGSHPVGRSRPARPESPALPNLPSAS